MTAANTIGLLDIEALTVEFATRNGIVQAVRGVDLSIAQGTIVGVVGESGSGKSVTSYSVLRILDRAGRIVSGAIRFSGMDLVAMPEAELQDIRGREISMVFQNPRASLNPIRRVGRQIADVLLQHGQATRNDARQKAVELLRLVRIADPERRADAYPFELSGGMCQRVVIAIALACRPRLLIADEPTTGLDVTTQKAVMDLIVDLGRARHMATLLITHDLGLAADYCDELVIMRQGEVVERGRTAAVLGAPAHAYTQRLVRATPRRGASLADLLPLDAQPPALPVHPIGNALLQVEGLTMAYPGARSATPAVDRVGFVIREGESVGLVGESGSGKSTVSALVSRLLDPTSGRILLDGRDISAIPSGRFAADPDRAKIQLVFQDATDSLNPRHTAARCIADPLRRLGPARGSHGLQAKIEELADGVGLPRRLLDRFPHQLSGGQKARVGIARAIALRPKLLILDEPTAALDVSVQALVLNLLAELKARFGMSYLFVSHDLQVVRLMCTRVLVMRGGRIIEEGPTEQVMTAPAEDYTRDLLAAIPGAASRERSRFQGTHSI